MNSDSIRQSIDRAARFTELMVVNQSLILKLYGSYLQYLNSSPHFLEAYIFEFDTNMGDIQTVYNLSIRLGIRVPPGSDPDIFVYDLLKRIIETPAIPGFPNPIEVIMMSKEQYSQIASQFLHPVPDNFETNFINYYDQRVISLFERIDNLT